MNKFVIIGVVVVVLLTGGGAGAYFYLNENGTGEPEGPKIDERDFVYVEVPPVVANFDVKGKMRYLQITVSLQTRDIASSNAFKANLPMIQSELLTLMQGSSFNDITTIDGKAAFIKRIESNVKRLFKDKKDPIELEQAMLTGFVVQ